MSPVLSKEFSKYLRVPYLDKGRDMRGWDCFGLYRWVLAERHGVVLPSYASEYDSADDAPSVGGAFGACTPLVSRLVALGGEAEADAVVFRVGGIPWHCGYVIWPGMMLHARKGCDTVIEQYTTQQWIKRIEGIYRCKP